ncbi:MAG TPA: shikimate kinase [Gemmatimonadaceae bacterium]
MIHLIGPGGAGKSTIGRILADLIRCPFHDLDRLFEERQGDIDDFMSIATQPSTFVLLPSLDLEECVTETVRRQRERPLAHHRSDRREEDVIRQRFPVYMDLPARKVSTMGQAVDIAAEIVTLISTL